MLQTNPSSGIPAGLRKRPTAADIAAMLGDDELKTLYVHRPLTNPDDVIAWMRAAGFKKTLPASDMHVTVAFSKTPVDWDTPDEATDTVIVPTGTRSVEPLGDKGAVVLRFDSEELAARWQVFKNAGASWDYPTFQPHLTITYDAGDVDLSTIEPYMGPLEFGGEVFAEIEAGWHDKAKASEIKNQDFKVRDDLVAADSALRLALDRESVRQPDRDGRMRVKVANISKACVNPYKGHEIPDWEKLGLDPNHVYHLLRDPEELAKAASTFNGVQVLQKHVPVSADDHQPWEVVGSTGTDSKFVDPYLQNSLSIWTRGAIDGIESDAKRELSSAYHYRADMTPGEFDGKAFDGVMRDIVGNHVALVEDGRAGPDVVVGDSSEEIMSTRDTAIKIAAIASRTATVGSLYSYLRPRLAMDAKPIGMNKVFAGITGKNFKDQKPVIAKRIRELAKPQLAKDANLDDVEKVLDMLDGHQIDGGTDAEVSEAENTAIESATNAISQIEPPTVDASEGLRGFLKEKGMGEDDINTACEMFPKKAAIDEDPDEKKKREEDEAKKKKDDADKAAKDAEMDKDKVTKPAMDAAIAAAVVSTTKAVKDEVRATERAIRKAEQDVRPYVGELAMAFDSAEDVYRHALTSLGVAGAKDIHASALPTILAMQPKAGARAPERHASLGMDASAVDKLSKKFPGLERIQSV